MFLYSTVSTLKPVCDQNTSAVKYRTADDSVGLREAGNDWRTNSRDGCDDFTELELVEDGGLSGGVQTNH